MDEPEHPPFGDLLKDYRLDAGLTQEELAERAGLSSDAVSTLERGSRRHPHRDTVRLLAEALRLTPPERAILEASVSGVVDASASGRRVRHALPIGGFLGALPRGPLVAREEEMRRLHTVLDTVAAGTGQLVLVAGEPGVGKTRLVQEVMVACRDRGFAIGTARCYPREHLETYVPIFEALAELAANFPAAVKGRMDERLQGLREQRHPTTADDAAAAGLGDDQVHLFASVTHLLLDLATSVPVALMLDDLQWADDGSIDLLHHLAHSTRGAPVLLLGTFQDIHLRDLHPVLARTLQELSRECLLEQIVVRRLSAEETATLAAVIMGQRAVAEDLSAVIFRRTRGVARLVDQMVRSFGGRLQLLDEIGAGAMGRVFRAYDAHTDQPVAAKLLVARAEIDQEALLRFQQEAAVLATLQHPNIVRIYDTFIEEHAGCIIMELLEGQSLRTVLRAGPLPLPRARHLVLQVAEALAYAHTHGIVHRDIKPDNIMVLEGDQVKVTDFGIARMVRPDTTLQTIASTGVRMGTPLYMSPEQIKGQKVDARSDIYSLGAVMYQLVTGQPPFEGDDPLNIAIKQLQEPPLPPGDLNPRVPDAWDTVILRALSKDPARRFQTAVELHRAIERLSVEPADRSREAGRREGWLRHKPAIAGLAVAGAGIAIAVLLIAAFLLRGHSPGAHAPLAATRCEPAFAEVTGLGPQFSDLAYAGFQRAVTKLRIRRPLFFGVPQTGDYATQLSLAASRHPCLVVAFGPQFQTNVMTGVFQRYPRVHFALIDAQVYDTEGFPMDLPNVEQLPVATEQSGYLVGYLAGLMEKMKVGKATHGVIGAQGGVRWPQVTSYIHGYRQGAKAAYPRVKILVDYSNSISDTTAAHNIGERQIDQGADILFNVGSFAGNAYMDVAAKRGVYAIGVDVDQRKLGGYVLTSALKHLDSAVQAAMMDAVEHRFQSGVHRFGLARGGAGIAKPSSIVPVSIVAQVRAQEQKILRGQIRIKP